jgi:glutamine amidotransferase
VLALIDYRAGNLTSVRKAFGAIGADVATPAAPGDLAAASGIIVPGVGHFNVTAAIDESWRAAIRERVAAGVPLLGICVGLQFLFEGSEEAPGLAGLGLFPGTCALLRPADGERLKVPHVGWNTLTRRGAPRILDGIADEAFAYFTHSYAAPVVAGTVAQTTHGAAFSSVVERGNVFGAQFHPEKSSAVGLRLLTNFVEVTRC